LRRWCRVGPAASPADVAGSTPADDVVVTLAVVAAGDGGAPREAGASGKGRRAIAPSRASVYATRTCTGEPTKYHECEKHQKGACDDSELPPGDHRRPRRKADGWMRGVILFVPS